MSMFREIPLSRAYRLLHPKLVVLIVTKAGGRVNIMTAAWAMPASVRPPLIVVSVAPSRYTYELVKASGEFTLNVATADMLKAAHYCGSVSGRSVDKVKAAGLSLMPSLKVTPPCLADAAACLECKLWGATPAGDHELLIGEVVAARAREGLFGETYDVSRARLLLHLGGNRYTTNSGEVVVA